MHWANRGGEEKLGKWEQTLRAAPPYKEILRSRRQWQGLALGREGRSIPFSGGRRSPSSALCLQNLTASLKPQVPGAVTVLPAPPTRSSLAFLPRERCWGAGRQLKGSAPTEVTRGVLAWFLGQTQSVFAGWICGQRLAA